MANKLLKSFPFIFPLLISCSVKNDIQKWENYTNKPKQWNDNSTYFYYRVNEKQAKSDAANLLNQLKNISFEQQTIYFGESKNTKTSSLFSSEELFGNVDNKANKNHYGLSLDYDSGGLVISTSYQKLNSQDDSGDVSYDTYRFRQTNFYTSDKSTEYTTIDFDCSNDFAEKSFGAIMKIFDSTSEKIDSKIEEYRRNIADISWLAEFLEMSIDGSLDDLIANIEFNHIYSKSFVEGDKYAVIFSAKITENNNLDNQTTTKIYNYCPALNMYEVTIRKRQAISGDTVTTDVYNKYMSFGNTLDSLPTYSNLDLVKEAYSGYDEVDYDLITMPYLAENDEDAYSTKLAKYFQII